MIYPRFIKEEDVIGVTAPSDGKIDDFTSSIMGIYWINLVVALFISIVFNKILTKLLDLALVTLVMLVIYSFGIAVVTLYNARISLDYEYKKYIKVSLASTIGNVGLSLIFLATSNALIISSIS